MKLYIKQKAFSWKDRFKVYDENEQVRYYAESDSALSFTKRLHLYAIDGTEVALVKSKPWSFLPRYEVFRGGEDGAKIFEVVGKWGLHSDYTLDGLGMKIEGSLSGMDYIITDLGHVICSIHKKRMSWSDTYEVEIEREEDERLAITVVLAIDAALAAAAAAAAAAT